MPDGDYLAWRASGKWRKVAHLLRDRASAIEIEDAMTSAAAETVRKSGGVPHFFSTISQICENPSASITSRVVAAHTAADTISTRLFDTAAQELASSMRRSLALVSPGSAAEALARRYLAGIVASGVESSIPSLIGDGELTFRDVHMTLNSHSSSTPMDKLVERFLRDPGASRLRAPRRRTAKIPMYKLMTTSLTDL